MVDLDSNPTKLIEVVEIGKQLLITRGSLTTFSIANDVAKYFAIIPAMFVGGVPRARPTQHHEPCSPQLGDPLGRHLQRARHRRPDPARAARGAVPAARPRAILRRNLLIYGLGGIIAPFIGIKVIDLIVRPGSEVTCAHSCSRACGCCSSITSCSGSRTRSSSPGSRRALIEHGRRVLVEVNGTAVGSALLGQPFDGRQVVPARVPAAVRRHGERRHQPRPDEPRTRGCGPRTVERYRANGLAGVGAGRRRHGIGSGLDPHISVANARLQAPRVAAARGSMSPTSSRLIDDHTDDRSLGFLGEPGSTCSSSTWRWRD